MGAGPFGAGPLSLLSPVNVVSGLSNEFGEGGPAMSVYVGIDVHRNRSQVAVIDEGGKVLANRNVPNGVKPILSVIGGLPAGTPRRTRPRSAGGGCWSCSKPAASSRTWCTRCSARRSPRRG